MPPFLRLMTLRSVLLLIVACLHQNGVIQLVRSDLSEGYTIQIGELTSIKEAEENIALAKLSNGLYQQAWWKLAKVEWRHNDSAMQRFFDTGPLKPEEMRWLAENSGNSNPWGKSNFDSAKPTENLMVALQKLSTANYKMSQTIKGTGKIEASMWTLLFLCMDTSSCNDGYFVPIVTIPKDQNEQEPANVSTYRYSYAMLCLNLTDNLVVNAIPSSLNGRFSASSDYPINGTGPDTDLSIVIRVHDAVPQCANSTTLGLRSLLDASYGLVPGSACIRFSQVINQQFNLLVLLGQSSVNGTLVPSTQNFTSFIHSLLVDKTEDWEQRPFEECSTAMVIMSGFQYDTVLLCDHNSKICIYAHTIGNATCKGLDHLRFLQSVASLSNSCTLIDYSGKPTVPLDSSLVHNRTTAYSEVSCRMNSSTKCEALISFSDLEFGSSVLFSPQSKWTSTEGNNTSEFSQAPQLTEPPACIKSLSSQIVTNTGETAFLEAIQIRATANLNSFIAEHNLAFTTAQGPSTDVANFLALVVSTAISVILGISGSFTNFVLKKICRWRPSHLDSRRSTVRKVAKVLFQILCNVLLSFCSFLPLMYLAWSELQREHLFNTWDLASEDQYIYSPIENLQLRVVYLLSASSKYRSHFIGLTTGVVCGSCTLVGVSAALRLREVYNRNTLLQKYDSILAGKGPEIKTDITEDRATLYARALKAIDMTDGEELNLKAEVRRHENIVLKDMKTQELAQYCGQATAPESQPATGRESPESLLLPEDFIPSA